ncbi:Gfo/Idh/MocA family protein [Streptomyces sp. NBC_00083]|uniref:Gfo/Idh/MocA family protein n=1 Tax=Streptomyces sp. NBC_00083 TaxID=2975647 RepID=UPI002252A155|nr:Gfo/Idh/MocA family oxidoreductase [Streptomyces sp. NBC_00083]MCX5382844.1 Gfo/Idh/MocA family oxidoreductase [Streptomyces sp. NBC_00083]
MNHIATTPRIGLLGTGPWAVATHAPALAAHPGVDFAGVWGRRPEAAAALAEEHGVAVYEDPDALFAACDAVAFALPPDVQAPLAVRAAAAGCHLLLDKPVATDVAGARAVADAAGRAGVASVVFFTLRFARETATWVARQAAAQGWFTGRARWYGALFTPGAERSPYAASPWRGEKGALWDVGPHALAVLAGVFGEITQVTAAGGPGDTAHLILRHASGASSTADLSFTAPPAAAGVEVELLGEAGADTMPDWDGALGAFGAAIDALLEAARTGVPHPCDARFGARITELLADAEAQLGRA